ncbi:hypothetical protein N473_21260 [Pseudoalteromonas luteoviolacea CPMOR-1]|uniref:Uncharacterized protein n=1 Tax=Pseudoalteromonas luteoviolacea CPMOR-1 TaxID=1365248 RepID=A0A167K3D6_9GAMM|nr:hypothetical protein N473_21260 [Pseudoalteromonas luteoviolacea CPMOR-1]
MLNKFFRKESSLISFIICETENDSPELDKVTGWFKERGFKPKEKSWDVVGSQELVTYTVSNGCQEADLLFETYFKELEINT